MGLIIVLSVAIVMIINYSVLLFWTGWVTNPAYWKIHTRNYKIVSNSEYTIRLSPAVVEGNFDAVLQAKEDYLALMDDYFGISPSPPLVIVLSMTELNSFVGGGHSLTSAGAYVRGVILLGMDESGSVSPGTETLVHELGHYYVDILARGNYPTWYSEGVAQLMEHHYLDKLWFDGIKDNDYYKYSITELSGDFYNLEDLISAYVLAYKLVLAIEDIGGVRANQLILRDLGKGVSFSNAMEIHIGLNPDELYNYVLNLEK